MKAMILDAPGQPLRLAEIERPAPGEAQRLDIYGFGAAPLDAAVWLFILPFGLAMLLLEEGRNAWVRRRSS